MHLRCRKMQTPLAFCGLQMAIGKGHGVGRTMGPQRSQLRSAALC